MTHSRATPSDPESEMTPIDAVPVPGRDADVVEIRLDSSHATFPPVLSPEESVLLLAKVIDAINEQDIDAFLEHFSARPSGMSIFPYPPGLSIQDSNASAGVATSTSPTDDDVVKVLEHRFPHHDRLQLLEVVVQSFDTEDWIGMAGNIGHEADDVEPHLAGFIAAITTIPSPPVMFGLRIVARRALGTDQFLELPPIQLRLPAALVVPDAT